MSLTPDPRAHPDIALPLTRLLAIRLWARQGPRARVHQARQGRLGRVPGLSFRELRVYQAGDEVRHIDWRVTARLGRPHTRLYAEEQEQAHWLLLDLSPALYFGSGPQLKARLGCELAAALLWQGEKQANTLICHGLTPQIQPQHGSLVPLLETLCRQYEAGLAEGHYIAETARARVLSDPRVLDALIHVDPENDAARRPALALPPRGEIAARLEAALAQRGLRAAAINLHYLSTGLEIDVTLASDPGDTDAALAGRLDADALKREFGARRIGFTRTMPAQA